jgi:hypothetical protein
MDEALNTIPDELLLSMQLRRLMDQHSSGLTEGIAYQLGYHPDMTGESLLKCLAVDLPRLLRAI